MCAWLVALNGMCAKRTTRGTILKRLPDWSTRKNNKREKILLIKKRFDYFIANITSSV